MRSESEFLVDVLGRLNSTDVAYMLTGSMASNFWGMPRTTHDLDFVLILKRDEVDRFVAAFASGCFIQPESVRAAFQAPYQFNVLDEQSALKADFWLLRDDAFEHTAFERRRYVELFGQGAYVATAEDVLLHKLYWNRITPSQRQLSDAAGVYSVQGDSMDLEYLRKWAAVLHVEPELEGVLSGQTSPKST